MRVGAREGKLVKVWDVLGQEDWERDTEGDLVTHAEALPVFVAPTVTTVFVTLGETDMVRLTECVREALKVHSVAVTDFVAPPLLTVRVRVKLTVGERVLVAPKVITERVRERLILGESVLVAPTLAKLRVTDRVLERLPVREVVTVSVSVEVATCASAPPRSSSE